MFISKPTWKEGGDFIFAEPSDGRSATISQLSHLQKAVVVMRSEARYISKLHALALYNYGVEHSFVSFDGNE